MKLVGNGFVTELPDGWEDRSLITLTGPAGKTGFVTNVVVTRERLTTGVDLEAYVRQERKHTPIPGLEVLDESGAEIDGAPAHQRLQRLTIDGHCVLQQQTFVLGTGRVVFVITATAAVEEFEAQFALFHKVLESFRFFDPATAVS